MKLYFYLYISTLICNIISEGIIDAVAQKDARQENKWKEAGLIRACWSSPTPLSTTIHGRLKGMLSLDLQDLTLQKPAMHLQLSSALLATATSSLQTSRKNPKSVQARTLHY